MLGERDAALDQAPVLRRKRLAQCLGPTQTPPPIEHAGTLAAPAGGGDRHCVSTGFGARLFFVRGSGVALGERGQKLGLALVSGVAQLV